MSVNALGTWLIFGKAVLNFYLMAPTKLKIISFCQYNRIYDMFGIPKCFGNLAFCSAATFQSFMHAILYTKRTLLWWSTMSVKLRRKLKRRSKLRGVICYLTWIMLDLLYPIQSYEGLCWREDHTPHCCLAKQTDYWFSVLSCDKFWCNTQWLAYSRSEAVLFHHCDWILK